MVGGGTHQLQVVELRSQHFIGVEASHCSFTSSLWLPPSDRALLLRCSSLPRLHSQLRTPSQVRQLCLNPILLPRHRHGTKQCPCIMACQSLCQ